MRYFTILGQFSSLSVFTCGVGSGFSPFWQIKAFFSSVIHLHVRVFAYVSLLASVPSPSWCLNVVNPCLILAMTLKDRDVSPT